MFKRFFSKDINIPTLRLSGVIGQAGIARAGLTISGIEKLIDKLFADKKSPAVALIINSPGGSPTQSSLIAEKIIKLAKEKNKKVGVSLNPETKIDLIIDLLDQINLVLIMSVNPGFGGQKFMPEVLDKIKELKKIREQKELDFDIEIDGGINFDNCKSAIDAGANIFVSGTTVFKSNDGDIKKNINLLKLK